MPADKYESVQPDVTVYCLVQLISLMIEFYDEIAGGYFKFDHNELPTINDLMNREMGQLINHLNQSIETDFPCSAPYPEFKYEDITESWFDSKKPEMLSLKSQIEVSTAPGSGGGFPRQFGIVITTVTPKVKDYARLRAKWDADQFARILNEQKQQSNEISRRSNELFPKMMQVSTSLIMLTLELRFFLIKKKRSQCTSRIQPKHP